MSVGAVAVIGLGVIGGSAAKALRRAGARVRGCAASATDREAARADGVDVSEDVAPCVDRATVVLIAVPVTDHASVAARAVDAAPADAVILHAAGLQRAAALATAGGVASYPGAIAARAIGTHPLAGSHRSGYAAASADVFEGCVVSIEARADKATRAVAEAFWRAAGAAAFEYRTADEHDDLMTWVSHLPQLASTALAHAIASGGVPASALGPGGRDATRLASSQFDTWAGILMVSHPGAARAVEALERSAMALRVALEAGDMETVGRIWTAARAWRNRADAGLPQGPPARPR